MSRSWDVSRIKLIAVACLFGLALLGLWARAAQVQLVRGPELAAQAERQHVTDVAQVGMRGSIVDRSGRVLAKSVRFSSVFVRPGEIDNARKEADGLAPVLGIKEKQLRKRLESDRPFVWLARQVDDRTAAQVAALDLPGVHLDHEEARLYPMGHLCGQLLGFGDLDGRGLEGVERSQEEVLSGERAEVRMVRDATGRKLALGPGLGDAHIDGSPVRLTIDAQVQDVAETALARAVTEHHGRWGTCLVVDVDSREILGWASYPFFNPNTRRRTDPAEWRNRALCDAFEPGSTMKPFLIAAALQEGVVTRDSIYYCEDGRWRLTGHTIRDTHDYGWLSVNRILRYSSNIGAAKIGLELGARRYHAYLSALGFGKKTGVDLPGESVGMLRDGSSWYPLDMAAISFGQGLSVTALQLAQAYATLAGDGIFRPLRVVADPAQPQPRPVRVYDAEVAHQVLAMMVEVVEEDGTGRLARIEGLTVAGKTGTAQKASPDGGYGKKHVSSFVGLIPGDAPKYLILAVVDEPGPEYYGGVVAGPVVREVGAKLAALTGMTPEVPGGGTLVAGATDAGTGSRARERLATASAAPASNLSSPSGFSAEGAVAAGMVPDVRGLPLRRAVETLAAAGIMVRLQGEGSLVAKQDPEPGSPAERAGEEPVTLWLTS